MTRWRTFHRHRLWVQPQPPDHCVGIEMIPYPKNMFIQRIIRKTYPLWSWEVKPKCTHKPTKSLLRCRAFQWKSTGLARARPGFNSQRRNKKCKYISRSGEGKMGRGKLRRVVRCFSMEIPDFIGAAHPQSILWVVSLYTAHIYTTWSFSFIILLINKSMNIDGIWGHQGQENQEQLTSDLFVPKMVGGGTRASLC
jgi:hypothetical protein